MRAVVVLAAVAVLAGCGGGGTTTITVTKTVERTTTRTATVTVTQTQQTPTATTATTAAAPCLASALAGRFAVVPGSAGAGQIVYRLRLTNQGDSTCFVTGIPNAQLLGRSGEKLPTHVVPAQPGTTTAVRVDLAPGDAATADARFSPDVPGQGEQHPGACEPKAYTLRIAIGDGSVDAPITPATPVCERGTLQFKVLSAAR